MPIESITYINFASNNGGILSNISEGGLCFHTAGPVQKTEEHVWFSLDGYRIETNVELAWTDETQKAGGLRFNSLSPEMHEQLVKWMRKSRISSALSIARAQFPMLKTQALRALRPNQLPRGPVSDDHTSLQEVRPERKTALLLFCRGLFTGLLIAALLATGFLFHAYRLQVGESLVRLGERFGAKPSDQTASPPATTPVLRSEDSSIPLAEGVKSQAADHEPKLTGIAASRIFSRVSAPRVPAAVNSIPASDELGKPPQLEPANGPSSDGQITLREIASSSPSLGTDAAGAVAREAINRSARYSTDTEPSYSNSSAGKYFEVGNFRDEFRANQTMDELSHVGFHAIIVRSRLLWMNSYHVLVGPYSSQGEMEAARDNLGSRGINPRILQSKSNIHPLWTKQCGRLSLSIRAGCDYSSKGQMPYR
jgi:hypothetical protein